MVERAIYLQVRWLANNIQGQLGFCPIDQASLSEVEMAGWAARLRDGVGMVPPLIRLSHRRKLPQGH